MGDVSVLTLKERHFLKPFGIIEFRTLCKKQGVPQLILRHRATW